MMTVMLRHVAKDEGEFQPGGKLEEDESMPAEEMEATKLPQEEVEQWFSEEIAELDFAVEWPLSATKKDKYSRGDRSYFPIEKTTVRQRRLHTKSQPLEQLDEVIEEIRRLMLSSAVETANNEKLSRREPARAARKQQQQ